MGLAEVLASIDWVRVMVAGALAAVGSTAGFVVGSVLVDTVRRRRRQVYEEART